LNLGIERSIQDSAGGSFDIRFNSEIAVLSLAVSQNNVFSG